MSSFDVPEFSSPEGIICILKKASSKGEVYEILSLKQEELNGKSSFTLSRSSWASSNSNGDKFPQSLLDDFLIDGRPIHLQRGPRRQVHVLLSTHSGTGQSVTFYRNILAPLLEELGLAASSETEQRSAARNGSYELLITQDAGSVKEFARGLGERIRDGKGVNADGNVVVFEKDIEHTVVLLSGDGGIVEMLNGYASMTDNHMATVSPDAVLPLIAILPLGTGNALFNSLHKTVKTPPAASDLVQGLRTLLRGKSAPLPSFKAVFPEKSRTVTYSDTSIPIPSGNGSTGLSSILGQAEQSQYLTHLYGVVVASYGFHSQLVWESDTPEYRQHGAKRFQMVAEELLRESHAYQATVEIGVSREGSISTRRLDRGQHSYILATLVSNLEKTFCISPASKPLDGQLWLVHFGPVERSKIWEIMMAAYNEGKHVSMRWPGDASGGEDEDGVGYDEVVEVRVTTHEEDPRWRKVCIDGTIVEIPAGGCMVVSTETKQHLSVLVDREILSYS
ncbi:ATP-NAD kinase-like domain-containing protein [Xylaria nigripes]|nr:ATP-NAD kinase-like domain-containing protein [Xylaria nigripes]